jgi:hypothetical protein
LPAVQTEKDRLELRAILDDPVKSMEHANRSIDAWVLQGLESNKSSRNSKKRS